MNRIRNLFYSVEKSGAGDLVPITVKELGDLLLAAETLVEVASDMELLKANLMVDRGRTMIRKSDITTSNELDEMITSFKCVLAKLGVDNFSVVDTGDFITKRGRL